MRSRLQRAMVSVLVLPAFDPYRDDPRFITLLERMNLAE